MSFQILLGLAVFFLGLIIGSFLNVVILRYGTGEGLLGRSRCGWCGKLVHWFENIPVLSYVFLFGRCRRCKKALSLQYPLVELATGLVFLFVWLKLTTSYQLPATSLLQLSTEVIVPLIFYFVAFSLLIVIFVYDLYHKIIPDLFSYTLAALGLVAALATLSWPLLAENWLHLAAGPILFVPFWGMWYFSGGRWMGLGDGKLVLGLGWLLGLSSGVAAVMLSFWIGAAVAVVILLVQRVGTIQLPFSKKQLTMKSEIPFGPFLIIGFALVFFCDLTFLDLALFFSFS